MLDCGLVDEHHRNVVLDGIHAVARDALERRAVLDQRDWSFAVGTGQNLEQFRVDSHSRDYMTPTGICGTIRAMKIAVLLLAVLGTATLVEAGQSGRAVAPSAAQPSAIAQAYEQFLLAHRLDDENNQEGAIQAYRRAMALDPTAADIVASLADLYMRTNRNADAMAMGEQALKIAPANREAHRVLGTIYASRLGAENASPDSQRDDLERATRHLEQAVERQPGGVQSDANLRAMLARLYVAGTAYDKAIPILSELVRQEPSWPDGATLLVDAYAAANRGDEAIQFLEEAAQDNPQLYATLADFYGRSRRYREAAGAYEQALAGNTFDTVAIDAAVNASVNGVNIMGDHFASEDYRRHIAKTYLKKALEAVA